MPISASDLELSFGFVAAEDTERPLPEITTLLEKWCEENRLKYSYNHARKEYVFAWLDWKLK